jgi:hypothetical protein
MPSSSSLPWGCAWRADTTSARLKLHEMRVDVSVLHRPFTRPRGGARASTMINVRSGRDLRVDQKSESREVCRDTQARKSKNLLYNHFAASDVRGLRFRDVDPSPGGPTGAVPVRSPDVVCHCRDAGPMLGPCPARDAPRAAPLSHSPPPPTSYSLAPALKRRAVKYDHRSTRRRGPRAALTPRLLERAANRGSELWLPSGHRV